MAQYETLSRLFSAYRLTDVSGNAHDAIGKDAKLLVQRAFAFAILSSTTLQSDMEGELLIAVEAMLEPGITAAQFRPRIMHFLNLLGFPEPIQLDFANTMNQAKYLALRLLSEEDGNYTGAGCRQIIENVQKVLAEEAQRA